MTQTRGSIAINENVVAYSKFDLLLLQFPDIDPDQLVFRPVGSQYVSILEHHGVPLCSDNTRQSENPEPEKRCLKCTVLNALDSGLTVGMAVDLKEDYPPPERIVGVTISYTGLAFDVLALEQRFTKIDPKRLLYKEITLDCMKAWKHDGIPSCSDEALQGPQPERTCYKCIMLRFFANGIHVGRAVGYNETNYKPPNVTQAWFESERSVFLIRLNRRQRRAI